MAKENTGVIAEGIVVKGEIGGTVDLIIEGKVEGSIQMDQNVLVGLTGKIAAEVNVKTLAVEGNLQGSVSAAEVIALRRGSRTSGELKAPRIVIDKEAYFVGDVEMDVPLPDNL